MQTSDSITAESISCQMTRHRSGSMSIAQGDSKGLTDAVQLTRHLCECCARCAASCALCCVCLHACCFSTAAACLATSTAPGFEPHLKGAGVPKTVAASTPESRCLARLLDRASEPLTESSALCIATPAGARTLAPTFGACTSPAEDNTADRVGKVVSSGSPSWQQRLRFARTSAGNCTARSCWDACQSAGSNIVATWRI